MAQLIVENLDHDVIEKLKALAQQNGRSLQEQLKHILRQAAETAVQYNTSGNMAKVRETVARSQARYVGKSFSDSSELIRGDRER